MASKVKLNLDEKAEIILNKPDKKNALDEALLDELSQAVTKVKDSNSKAAVLRGEGDTFCSGLDRNLLAKLAEFDEDELKGMPSAQKIIYDIHTLNMPVIASVERYAIGAGIQLALAADMRIASPGTIFQVKEPEFGIIPDMGALYLLPRIVGEGLARDMIFTRREVTAEEGKEIGLINEVSEDPEEVANKYLEEFLSLPNSKVFEESKKLIEKSWVSTFEESLEDTMDSQVDCIENMKK